MSQFLPEKVSSFLNDKSTNHQYSNTFNKLTHHEQLVLRQTIWTAESVGAVMSPVIIGCTAPVFITYTEKLSEDQIFAMHKFTAEIVKAHYSTMPRQVCYLLKLRV